MRVPRRLIEGSATLLVSGITGRKSSTVLTVYDGEGKSNLILDVTNSECECAWDSALKPMGEFWNRGGF